MKFSSLLEQIATARTETELRANFMEGAGSGFGATAWGFDLLNVRDEIVAADLSGISDRFQSDYRHLSHLDSISHHMMEYQIPVHTLSFYTPQQWRRSTLYQCLFKTYHLEHGMVAPLIGNGRLIGGIYFLRDRQFPAFCDRDLLYLSTLCQHLSVRLATLRLPTQLTSSATTSLTTRELEIAELVAQGFSNREISVRLSISHEGVKQALKRMFRKLEVSARAEMVAKLK